MRQAQFLVVEIKKGHGSPPDYDVNWQPVWDAKVESIVRTANASPSHCTMWFPSNYWTTRMDILVGDLVRIRTNTANISDSVIVFQGFITKPMYEFSGGNERGGKFERQAIFCQDYRWLLAVLCPIFGQIGRGPDDYNSYGTTSQSPKAGSYTFFTGRRCIFNINGRPNSEYELLDVEIDGSTVCEMPVFGNPDDPNSVAFTAGEMIQYILSPLINWAYKYISIPDPSQLTGLDHSDWNQVINHVSIEGLSVPAALQAVCKQIGWSYRESYSNNSGETIVNFVFYKSGTAGSSGTTTLHNLYAPDVDENISSAVLQSKKMLWAAQIEHDIATIVNNPWGLGAPQRFEFTAELVPGWLDTDLTPDTSESLANLFFTESELSSMGNPNDKSFYKYYHSRGSDFRRDVGRKWALNESGRFTKTSASGLYDRGMPFDFSTVIPANYILDREGRRLFGPFDRQLLPCLTVDKEGKNSIGIIVEFSFDGGTSWQQIPCAMVSLKDQCGIYITEPNLSEMAMHPESTISGGTLDGAELNYYTSLCDDKLESRSFKDGQWKTRLRVTASVQLDCRLATQAAPTASGSPFYQRDILDFSDSYNFQERTSSSIFADTTLPSDDRDDDALFGRHLDYIRDTLQDASISAQFTLERLWLSDFEVGDGIAAIEGRNITMRTSFANTELYPEIVQIIILPQKQKMKLITRDLRFSEFRQ